MPQPPADQRGSATTELIRGRIFVKLYARWCEAFSANERRAQIARASDDRASPRSKQFGSQFLWYRHCWTDRCWTDGHGRCYQPTREPPSALIGAFSQCRLEEQQAQRQPLSWASAIRSRTRSDAEPVAGCPGGLTAATQRTSASSSRSRLLVLDPSSHVTGRDDGYCSVRGKQPRPHHGDRRTTVTIASPAGPLLSPQMIA
jgi:hypothetical protein